MPKATGVNAERIFSASKVETYEYSGPVDI